MTVISQDYLKNYYSAEAGCFSPQTGGGMPGRGNERKAETENEDRALLQFAEKCLYEYKLNLSRIDTLREKLSLLATGSTVKAQTYEPIYSGGGHSDPVAWRMERIDSLERRIAELENRTAPITRMVRDWSEAYGLENSQNRDMLQLLELRYFAGGTWPQAAEKLGISMTSIKEWRQKLVRAAREYLCL
ncbi:MAG: hypothetical protein K5841_06165 [Fretibacterium sp.]|nr:hypothetical protein [Fretibacterium sp.]